MIPSLVPVAHVPLICYVLRWFLDGGIVKATICANSDSRAVRRCLGDGLALGLNLDYYEDRIPRGPAGCVRDVAAYSDEEILVVAEGTVIPQVDLKSLLDAHTASVSGLTLVVNKDSTDGGSDQESLVPGGIYLFARHALDQTPETGYQDIKEVLIPELHDRGERVLPYVAPGNCLRVRNAGDYFAAGEWILGQLLQGEASFAGYRWVAETLVHRTAQCPEGTKLVGPILIGPGTEVGWNVTVVGPTTIGVNCKIGDGSVICRAVLWDRCNIGRNCIIDRCLLADDADVPSGMRLRNTLHVSSGVPSHLASALGRHLQQISPPIVWNANRTTGGIDYLRNFRIHQGSVVQRPLP